MNYCLWFIFMAKMELSIFPLGAWQGSACVLLSVDNSITNLLMHYGKKGKSCGICKQWQWCSGWINRCPVFLWIWAYFFRIRSKLNNQYIVKINPLCDLQSVVEVLAKGYTGMSHKDFMLHKWFNLSNMNFPIDGSKNPYFLQEAKIKAKTFSVL